MSDEINAPSHYLGANGTQAIDIIEEFGLNFRLANVIKYVLRHNKKGKPISDLRKAAFYLAREISKREKASVFEQSQRESRLAACVAAIKNETKRDEALARSLEQCLHQLSTSANEQDWKVAADVRRAMDEVKK
jgi:hypothetical protein